MSRIESLSNNTWVSLWGKKLKKYGFLENTLSYKESVTAGTGLAKAHTLKSSKFLIRVNSS